MEGFLAWAEDVEVHGENIAVVWHERGAEDEWTLWAWPAGTGDSAAVWVQDVLGYDLMFDLFDSPFVSWAEAEQASSAVEPQKLVNGLFHDDPMQDLITEAGDDAPALIDGFVDNGYAAAPKISTRSVMDPIDASGEEVERVTFLMNGLTHDVETAVIGISTVNQEDVDWMDIWPCSCETTYGQPENCSEWQHTLTVPATGGGSTCHYKRECQVDWTKEGEYWYCGSCDDSGTMTKPEHTRVTVLPGEDCPSEP